MIMADNVLARAAGPSWSDRAFIHEAWMFLAARAFVFRSVVQPHIPTLEPITESGTGSVPEKQQAFPADERLLAEGRDSVGNLLEFTSRLLFGFRQQLEPIGS